MIKNVPVRSRVFVGVATTLLTLAWAPATPARVTRIVIDSTTPLTGQSIPYEQVRGRAFGELDPADTHNQIITDVDLGKDADGKVRYEATFVVTKPVDMSQASGFMWHDVPNRGSPITIVAAERELGESALPAHGRGTTRAARQSRPTTRPAQPLGRGALRAQSGRQPRDRQRAGQSSTAADRIPSRST